jgi:hypothetical protein
MAKFEIKVEVVSKVTYSEIAEFPTQEDGIRYIEAMIYKNHYINWEEFDVEEIGEPIIGISELK